MKKTIHNILKLCLPFFYIIIILAILIVIFNLYNNNYTFYLNQEEITIAYNTKYKVSVIPKNANYQNNYYYKWESANENILTIDENGNITPKALGNTEITIKSKKGFHKKTLKVNVGDIEITTISLQNINLQEGKSYKMTPLINGDSRIVSNLTYISDNTNVAIVDNNGVVKALQIGKATITVIAPNGKKDSCIVNVTENTIEVRSLSINLSKKTMKIHDTITLQVTINPSNASNKTIRWTSSDNSVATVNNGTVKAIKKGTATITAKATNGKKVTCKITVIDDTPSPKPGDDNIDVTSITLSNTSLSLKVGDKKQMTATINPSNATKKTITWSSDNSNVVRVDDKGNIEALKEGTATITAKAANGKQATCKITVTTNKILPTAITLNFIKTDLKVGETKTLSITKVEPNGAKCNNISYSANNSVVTVNNDGLITAKAPGTAEVTASCDGIKSKATIYVTQPTITKITLNTTSLNLKKGATGKLTIQSYEPSNLSCSNLTWSSNNTNIATVSGGTVTAKKAGTATITAICDKSAKATATITITNNDPVVPSSHSRKFEGTTLKYYMQNNSRYFLTYIWMDDPYTQTKKLEANVSAYNAVYTDDELTASGNRLRRFNIGQMLKSYIEYGRIPKEKQAIAFNASGFYVSGAWNPPSDYYDNRSDSWFVITDGKVIRNLQNDGQANRTIIGINENSNLRIYGTSADSAQKAQIAKTILSEKVLNTFSFGPLLVSNGKKVYTASSPTAHRQAICQIDANNYVMLTTIYKMTIGATADIFVNIGCQTAFNLDGGGSTQLFIKNQNSTSYNKIACRDGTDGKICRSIVEGIYFTE